jgi:phosphoglycerate kinase
MKSFKVIRELTKKDLKGKRVLLRLDLNVPVEGGKVTETYRIDRSLPTLRYLTERGAKILAISHHSSDDVSLKAAAAYLNKFFPVGFAPTLENLDLSNCLPDGSIMVFENLRFNKDEEKNSLAFAKELASHADIYVNEAFSASHRKHASIVGVTKLLPSYAGFLMEEEVKELSKAFTPKRPFVFVLGGAKFSTKIPLLKRFLKLADEVYLFGALVHALFKKKRWQIGRSLVDNKLTGIDAFLKNKKIRLPIDVVLENRGANYVRPPNEVGKEDIIYDAGPDSVDQAADAIRNAKFVLWNGPLGTFENGYDRATLQLARAIARSEAYSIIGGGDTIAAVAKLDILDKFDFVSTGGGAMLDFLSAGTLPGIEALSKNKIKLK